MNVSIVSGWLPPMVEVLAVVALLASLDLRTGQWRHQLAVGVPVAACITGAVALVLTLGSLVPDDFPWSAYVWGFTFALAVCSGLLGWTSVGRWRKVAMVAAVILTLAATLGSVNREADSFPTVGRLVTGDPENVVGTPELRAIKEQVAVSGRLPSQGVVIMTTIPPTVSHFSTRPAYVYLPPAWFAKVTPSLPTLVLLPGEPGSASDWSGDGDADNTADAFARTHHGLAPIIVMPDPNGYATVDSECVNSKFGNAETYLVDDVPAFARRQFSASSAPGSLAIGGLSAGGTCSIMLALRHPTAYPTFATFSGFASPQYQETSLAETIDTLFGGSEARFAEHDPVQLLRNGRFDGMAGWFEVGNQDQQPLEAARNLQPAALAAGIATCIAVRPGGHDFDLWSQALVDSFPWLSWRLGLTPEPATEPARCQSP
ncbi:MAG TPA: alpha/beta hydrolase-fold protein [Acidimicrobiales bacterium]|nr:alpha/beta hydrolase-fold protein [Acidimicrobiales bacterium]